MRGLGGTGACLPNLREACTTHSQALSYLHTCTPSLGPWTHMARGGEAQAAPAPAKLCPSFKLSSVNVLTFLGLFPHL